MDLPSASIMAFAKSILVTGGTTGLGYETALALAKVHPDHLVVVASRSDKNKAADSINEKLGQKNALYLPLDLSSLKNVRLFTGSWSADHRPPISHLLLNAGIQFPDELVKTTDGIEKTFCVNHVGHALLFHLLYEHLTPDCRVVVTSSGTHDPALKYGLPDAKYVSAHELAFPPADMIEIDGRQRYASSKLANVMWTYAIARRFSADTTSTRTIDAFDPGLMPGTGLIREGSCVQKFLWTQVMPRTLPLVRLAITPNTHTVQESAAALARLALGEDLEGKSGLYYEGMKPIPSSVESYDEKKQEDLWEWTVSYLAQSDEEKAKFQI